MKQQAQDKKDHEKIFGRLRLTENDRTVCDEKDTTVKNSIGKLEGNQKWGVVIILGTQIINQTI